MINHDPITDDERSVLDPLCKLLDAAIDEGLEDGKCLVLADCPSIVSLVKVVMWLDALGALDKLVRLARDSRVQHPNMWAAIKAVVAEAEAVSPATTTH